MRCSKITRVLSIIFICSVGLMTLGGCRGCETEVTQGYVGRVKTPDGWEKEVLSPGYHNCWGRDKMFQISTTEQKYTEPMNILVGGKVNLQLTISVRCRLKTEDAAALKDIFETVAADGETISHKKLYQTYLEMGVQAAPREVYGVQPDAQTVMANQRALSEEVKKIIMEAAKGTPLQVTQIEVTNYDWPKSITRAQEELVVMQLAERREEARVKASLLKAQGQLKVEEANKLVELKKAEALAESIDIIKAKLADSPEYLQWHTIRVLGDAANGPNNSFFVFPYNLPGLDQKALLNKALTKKVLQDTLPDKKPVKK